jgi:HSP20 family protein
MLNHMDSMFDSLMNRSRPLRNELWAPAVDVREEDDRYVLEAEIPGRKEDDIDVTVNEGLLTIASKDQDQKEENREGYVLRERRTMPFSRAFHLPNDADRESIEAHYEQGVLTLVIHKREDAKPRQIRINGE